MSVNISAIPNPLAPEAWLAPPVLENYLIYNYVVAGCMVVLIWDTLASLPEDIQLLFTTRFTFQSSVYVLSRFSSLAFAIVVFLASNLRTYDCTKFNRASTSLFVVAHAAASLLFYFRVYAVYHDWKYVQIFFGVAWAVLVAGVVLLIPFTTVSNPIGPTGFCKLDIREPYACVFAWTQGCFDLFVCAAVTYKLGCENGGERGGWRFFFYVKQFKLRSLASRFLLDSHIYFVVIALIKTLEIAVFYGLQGAGRGSSIQVIVAFPDVVLVSIMATRIFRRMRLGHPGMLASATQAQASQRPESSVKFQRAGGPVSTVVSGYGSSRSGNVTSGVATSGVTSGGVMSHQFSDEKQHEEQQDIVCT